MLVRTIAALFITLLLAAPAAAQRKPEPIAVAADQPFRHAHTKLGIPVVLDGLARADILALEDDQLDVYARYGSADESEALTVYVYREVSGALPVWFDRARWAIENRPDVYGTPRLFEHGFEFTPPGRTIGAGLIATYYPSQGPFRSTGVAIVPLGEWLVKIRYSSQRYGPEALHQRIQAVLAALDWPATLGEAEAATPVAPCVAPLPPLKPSKAVRSDGAGAILGAALGLPDLLGKGEEVTPAHWCRDDSVEPKGNVYRPDGAEDRYLIALSDAGRGIRVQPDMASLLLKKGKPNWSVEYVELPRTTAFPLQNRLPPPQQALEIVKAGHYVSIVPSWGDNKSITINSDAIK